MSGQSSGPFGIAQPGQVKVSTEQLANVVGCRGINDSYELVECLRTVPAAEIDFWGFTSVTLLQQHLPNFMPNIDGQFVPLRPEDAWYAGKLATKQQST